jgi:hypothetical protein
MYETAMDQEREAPLDALEDWIEVEDDDLSPVGAAIPTGSTLTTITVPPPPPE